MLVSSNGDVEGHWVGELHMFDWGWFECRPECETLYACCDAVWQGF